MEIIIAILTLGGLGFIFAGGLAFADKKLKVEENPLIAEVNQYLPNANCGGCGKAGCYDFAVNVVEGKIEINKCPVCNDEARNEIAKLLGQEISTTIKKIPIIHCQGGNSKANKKEVDYIGPKTCKTINLISGGENLCYYGCLGAGDCVNACQFGALLINNDLLIAGVDDLQIQKVNHSQNLQEDKLFHSENKGKFVLLLKHRPFVEKNSIGLFDLQLSGHVHKGQIFPFSLLTKFYYSVHAGFKKLADSSYLYVSRGSGTWGPPIRFLSKPEVTIIDISNPDLRI